jgi:hypothetical protein
MGNIKPDLIGKFRSALREKSEPRSAALIS